MRCCILNQNEKDTQNKTVLYLTFFTSLFNEIYFKVLRMLYATLPKRTLANSLSCKSWNSPAFKPSLDRKKKSKRIHICPYENCSFTNVGNLYKLTRHIEMVHLKLKKFSCSDCGGKFGRKDTLTYHKKHHCAESKIKPYL